MIGVKYYLCINRTKYLAQTQTAAILKMVISLYLSRFLSDFDEIWFDVANFFYNPRMVIVLIVIFSQNRFAAISQRRIV